jgi:hypothetical protein
MAGNEHAQRWEGLKTERSSWDAHWRELSDYLLPRSGRFIVSDRNRGEKRHNSILDNTGTKACRTLGAGLMAGMSSPSRPWFKLATPDAELNKYGPVKLWLADVTQLMLRVFAKSNTYRALHSGYEELGVFGTWSCIQQPDFANVIHLHPMTIGEFCIATNWKGDVDTLYRQFDATVRQLVAEFGLENCSSAVQNLYRSGALEKWVTVVHAIEPRTDRDPRKSDNKNMPWSSCYFELGARKGAYLRESGFKTFPSLAARWAVSGGDIYGNSPGMDALGDAKQLQHEQLRKAQGIDHMTNPAIGLPTSAKNAELDTLPGGVSYFDASTGGQGGRNLMDVRIDLGHLLADIQDVRQRIREAFSADLFLMLANSTNPQMTATEVAERHEEKMLMLGPVLERLTSELHVPLVNNTFDAMLSAGIVPPPPDELQGVDLNVEFVSMLAQAQRAVATNGVDRFVANLGQVAAFKPDVLDKFDADQWVDEYSDVLGVSPSMIVASDKVAIVRQQRAQAQQQAAQAERMNQMSQTAKNLGQTPTTGGNAASDVMNLFSGYTTAGA